MPAAIRKAIADEIDKCASWTIDTLRIHLLSHISSLASVADERFNAQDRSMISLQAKIDLLSSRLDRFEGSGSGLCAGWGYLVGGIGVVALIVSTIMIFVKH